MREDLPEPRSAETSESAAGRPERTLSLLERGRVRFFVRPRVELETVRSFSDVQKLAVVLEPRGGGLARSVHVGRKRMPDSRVREREWAYVDRVGRADELIASLTEASTYMTKTKGVRRQQGARSIASGDYGIVAHGDHVHLVTRATDYADDATDMLLASLRIVPRASYIAAVFNPEAKWRVREPEEDAVPFREPSIFDDEVMERFGRRRFAPLAPDLLDHEGAELVLIGGCAADETLGLLGHAQ